MSKAAKLAAQLSGIAADLADGVNLDALVEVLGEPMRLTAAQLGELEQIGKRSGSDIYEELPATDANRWLRAVILENSGEFAKAAELLHGLEESYAGEDRALRLLAYARNLIKAGDAAGAKALAEAAQYAASYHTLTAIDRLLKQLRKAGPVPSRRAVKIALLGTVSLDFWVPALRAQCYGAGIDATIHVGAFGQQQQEILDPQSRTAQFQPDVVLLVVDGRSLGFPDETADATELVGQRVAELRTLWRACREQWGAFVIQANAEIPCEDPFGQLSAALAGGRGRALRRFNLDLWEAAQAESGVMVLDLEQAAAAVGKQEWVNPALWFAARQYPAPRAIPVVTHHAMALVRAAVGLSAKCVALDLDGTLWGGVIGEDGLAGIQIGGGPVGEAYAAFQRYLKSLASRGILLAACSKNNAEDALAPLREHPEMILKEADFSVFLANWNGKDNNLREIARQINIGLDAIVFVDDNPTERARIRQEVPEVTVIEMPADPSRYVAALDAPRLFEAVTLTAEDRKRGQSIRENLERATLASQATNVDDYLAGLGMVAEIAPFNDVDLPRIVQLINKTNQFNMTTRRMNEADVRAIMAEPGSYTQSLRLTDRFGDSGLTGVLIAVREGPAMRIQTWLMSCRIMGRKLEQVVMAALAEQARVQGAELLIGEYLPTAKNVVVTELYPQLGFRAAGEGRFELRVEEAPAVPAFITVRSAFEAAVAK